LVTLDQSLPRQQNLKGRAFAVIVLRTRSSRLQDLLPLVPPLNEASETFGAALARSTCEPPAERSKERTDMVGDNGRIGVTCEFCSTYREFDPKDFDETA
jgi:hypothetical protein